MEVDTISEQVNTMHSTVHLNEEDTLRLGDFNETAELIRNDQAGPSNCNQISYDTCEASADEKVSNCEVCGDNPSKYTCPRCEVKTCCLKCAQIHKRELECDGTRDRTKFIPLNKFTNLDLSSDYRLLEEITRHIETYKKDRFKNHLRKDPVLPHFLFRLKNAAHKRNTIIKFLPSNFERHKRNTTRLNFAKDVVFWHIDWIFPCSDNLKLSDEKVRETEKLGSVLQKYFIKQDNEELQEKLLYYQSLGVCGVKAFLKAEERPGVKYYELDMSASIKDNLRKKVIIEYPTIHIVGGTHAGCYDVIDSDDEEARMDVDNKNSSGNEVINKIVKNAENDDVIYKSLKNLLFISENADSEISDDE